MNVVFYALIALSLGFAAWKGAPEADGNVQAQVLQVAAPEGLTPGTLVEVNGRSFAVERVEGKVATIATDLPDGEAHVRFGSLHPVGAVGKAALDSAKSSVDLAIGLVGAMTLFLGLMKVVEAAGGLAFVARALRPAMVRLFPDVPADHPAMGAMIMNLAANVLGLGNAATPFGIKAMQELETLNRTPGVATNAMVLFLAINTAGVAVLPTGVMAVRATLKSHDPAAIFVPTLLTTVCHTIMAVVASKFLARFFPLPAPTREIETPVAAPIAGSWTEWLPTAACLGLIVLLIGGVFEYGERASVWIIPGLIGGMLTVGVLRKVKVYEVFIEGARDGFASATRIIPYLVAVLVAVGMFRASGGMDALTVILQPACALIGMPPEVLPLALLRPLSGSGAFALTSELTKTHGPDSLIGTIAGTMQGSTETTFYVLSVYFGAVNVTKARHAILNGLLADVIGILGAIWFVRWLVTF